MYAPLPAAAAGVMLFFLADFPNFPLLTSPAAPVTLALHKERGCGGCGQLPAMWAAARPEGWGLGAVLTPLNPPSWAVLTPLNLPPLPPAASNPLEAPACARLGLLLELCVLGQLKNLPRRGRGAGGDLCSGYFPGLAGVYGLNSPVTSPSAFSRSKGWGFECLKTAGFC